jgi:hypothetical protein
MTCFEFSGNLGSLGVNCERLEVDRSNEPFEPNKAPLKVSRSGTRDSFVRPPFRPARRDGWSTLCIISHFALTHRMTNSQRLATVRNRLLRWLAEQQEGDADTQGDGRNPVLRESILIRDEFYCGRRFHAATHHAVWFVEEDELKIYRNGGELACVLSGDQLDTPRESEETAERVDQVEELESTDVIKLTLPRQPFGDSGDEIRRAA